MAKYIFVIKICKRILLKQSNTKRDGQFLRRQRLPVLFSTQTMKTKFAATALMCVACLGGLAAPASEEMTADTLERNGFKLIFVQQDPTFDRQVAGRLKETFFKVYPVLVEDFNPDAVRTVTITIDTAYDGVAYAHNGRVVIAQAWLEKMPNDIDVVTHEVMHIVQSYPHRSGPGWLVEGIADFVRYRYGVDNEGGGWSLPDLREEHHYTNSYRITARFLDWIERTKKAGLVKHLDKLMRSRMYRPTVWKEETGLELDELWALYVRGE